jgi:tartrate dehydratase alpha subunit/fumarate hydratase class I-like protein
MSGLIRPTESEIELTDCKDLVEQFVILKAEVSEAESVIKLKEKALSEIKNKLITKMQTAGKARCAAGHVARL